MAFRSAPNSSDVPVAVATNDGIPYLWSSGDVTTVPSNEVKITASDGSSEDYFGYSVAVGSGRIVVGAYGRALTDEFEGVIYIFDLDGNQLGPYITSNDIDDNGEFGYYVAVGSGRIVAGSPSDDDNGSSSGSAYIFDLDGNQLAKITAADGAASDRFGEAIAIGSGRIVVGANRDDDNGSDSGSAYIYTTPEIKHILDLTDEIIY